MRDIQPIIGYVHTGIEKSCEDQEYWKAITFVERMDYLAYYFNAMAYCMSVERCSTRRCRPRAQYLRVIHLELNRIASHLFWLGHGRAGHRRDHDALVGPARARPDPRPVRDVVGPAPPHALLPGGRRVRGHPARAGRPSAASFLEEMPSRIDQYEALLDQNEIWLQRTKNTGIVSREKLLELGVTGPLLRAAGEPWDLRKAMPYSRLRELRLQDPGGHAWATTTTATAAAWPRCASR